MNKNQTMSMRWSSFAAMILISVVLMFVLMYQLIYRMQDARFSMDHLIASLIMGFAMTIVMLAFMWRMLTNSRLKLTIMVISALTALALFFLLRSQTFISDVTYMQAMIPHHSIAVNNSYKARISDPRVRALADGIITSQLREIGEMDSLIKDIKHNGKQGNKTLLPARPMLMSQGMHSTPPLDDIGFMEMMIPHHQIAIDAARQAHITDPRVRKLADGIIMAQEREIALMKLLIIDLNKKKRN